ncbi:neurogenic locus notch homolog protein 3-like [Lytechinus variegatus]|uniref:neurogenic locus notch homolog protein 3-like n=1 Tax=Lytechinus variegatus TaxID=7654 RepID=UPI001BB2C865|nr:neurogenic locus notch homolog protein 3-like [Lytechinus variegatus]
MWGVREGLRKLIEFTERAIVILILLNHQFKDVYGTGTCADIPQDVCPYGVSEYTGEWVKYVPKYLTRDHPEYEVRTPPEARDKINLYCAHPACYSNPCLHGGSCMEELDGFSCSCPGIYFGIQCEQHACDSNPCLHGGACVEELDGYNCSCHGGYVGIHCEKPVCPDGWVYGGTKCFLEVAGRQSNWTSARDYCNGLDEVVLGNGNRVGPSLLLIESEEEYDLLKLGISVPWWYWLNCQVVDMDITCFTDRAGNTSDYRNWYYDVYSYYDSSYESTDCVAVDIWIGYWFTYSCSYPYDLTACQVNVFASRNTTT